MKYSPKPADARRTKEAASARPSRSAPVTACIHVHSRLRSTPGMLSTWHKFTIIINFLARHALAK